MGEPTASVTTIDEIPFYPASYDLPNILSVAAVHNEGRL